MINKKVKFLHVFWHNDLKFNPNVVRLIEDKENQLNPEEHYYLTPYKKVYDELIKYTDKVSLVCSDKPHSSKIINKFSKYCDWLIVHSIPNIGKAIFIKKKNWGKIVWRTWGHDIKYSRKSKGILKNLVKTIIELRWKKMVKSFYGVGIANNVDVIALEDFFGKLNTFRLSYSAKDRRNVYENISLLTTKKTSTLNILIGHSGNEINEHFKIMDLMKKYRNEDIKLYFILSYGKEEYILKVEKKIKDEWESKSVIIKEFLPFHAYIELLSNIDVAIFAGNASHALGNIAALLQLNKKIFLSKDGVIAKAFSLDNLNCEFIEEIQDMEFRTFKDSIDNSMINSSLKPLSYEDGVDCWRDCLGKLSGQI